MFDAETNQYIDIIPYTKKYYLKCILLTINQSKEKTMNYLIINKQYKTRTRTRKREKI